jgi:hypothetical protein
LKVINEDNAGEAGDGGMGFGGLLWNSLKLKDPLLPPSAETQVNMISI